MSKASKAAPPPPSNFPRLIANQYGVDCIAVILSYMHYPFFGGDILQCALVCKAFARALLRVPSYGFRAAVNNSIMDGKGKINKAYIQLTMGCLSVFRDNLDMKYRTNNTSLPSEIWNQMKYIWNKSNVIFQCGMKRTAFDVFQFLESQPSNEAEVRKLCENQEAMAKFSKYKCRVVDISTDLTTKMKLHYCECIDTHDVAIFIQCNDANLSLNIGLISDDEYRAVKSQEDNWAESMNQEENVRIVYWVRHDPITFDSKIFCNENFFQGITRIFRNTLLDSKIFNNVTQWKPFHSMICLSYMCYNEPSVFNHWIYLTKNSGNTKIRLEEPPVSFVKDLTLLCDLVISPAEEMMKQRLQDLTRRSKVRLCCGGKPVDEGAPFLESIMDTAMMLCASYLEDDIQTIQNMYGVELSAGQFRGLYSADSNFEFPEEEEATKPRSTTKKSRYSPKEDRHFDTGISSIMERAKEDGKQKLSPLRPKRGPKWQLADEEKSPPSNGGKGKEYGNGRGGEKAESWGSRKSVPAKKWVEVVKKK